MIKKIVKSNKKPELLVITPLSLGDKISKETKKGIKRNKVSFDWISYMGKGNPYKNTKLAYKQYRKDNGFVPKYVLKIDNDITPTRYLMDRMYNVLENSDNNIAYAYTSFEFIGSINVKFPLRPFNKKFLLKNNYISSMSMIKTQLLDQTGSFVIDDKYFRLLDWCLWLKFLKFGFIGAPIENAHFTAFAGPKSISCRGLKDYKEKYQHVKEDFINKIKID